MNWVTAALVFVIAWWMSLFCVLPIGVKTIEQPGPGYGTGAPENPRLGFKILLATGIACVLFGIVYYFVHSDWITFRGH